MRNLTLADLGTGIADLLDNRAKSLETTQTGKLYGPILSAKRKAIEHALKIALEAKAGDLSETDAQHDGLGGAIWHFTEAVLCQPFVSVERRDAARRIREAFIPDLGVLSDSYADEAAAAKANRPKLVALEAELRMLPTPDGQTLYEWAAAFVDKGDELARKLAARTQGSALEAFRQQTALRVTTIGILGRFRASLRDEIKDNSSLSATIESDLFAGIDALAERRVEANPAI
ncbi:MAG TPA: hypothetical protein PK156_00480 [Polyangium sp.]|nr:hypothetical protein [Polyangium sp.]